MTATGDNEFDAARGDLLKRLEALASAIDAAKFPGVAQPVRRLNRRFVAPLLAGAAAAAAVAVALLAGWWAQKASLAPSGAPTAWTMDNAPSSRTSQPRDDRALSCPMNGDFGQALSATGCLALCPPGPLPALDLSLPALWDGGLEWSPPPIDLPVMAPSDKERSFDNDS